MGQMGQEQLSPIRFRDSVAFRVAGGGAFVSALAALAAVGTTRATGPILDELRRHDTLPLAERAGHIAELTRSIELLMWHAIASSGTVAGVTVLFLAFIMTKARRTGQLAGIAQRIAAGDLDIRAEVSGRDEHGRLANAINQLREAYIARIGEARQRELVEEALRHSEARFRSLVELLPVGVAVVQQGRFVFMNREVNRWLGKGEVSTVRPLPTSSPGRHLLHATRAVTEPVTLDELRLSPWGGEPVRVHLQARPIEWDGGQAVLAVGRDVTEERRLRAQLAAQDRLSSVGTLAAGVAHEINNPLTYVLGNLQVLARTAADLGVEERRELVDEALEGALAVRRIVKDLGVFSRVDDEPHTVAVDVREALETAVRMARNSIRFRGELRISYRDVPAVRAEEGRLPQVFLNLLVNAAQAIEAGDAGVIEAACGHAGDEVTVTITDNGRGIPADAVDRLFDPFFTTKPVGEGTGLGLAICAGIVRGAGGRIEVDSEAGEGTTMRVFLPAAKEAAVERPAEPSGFFARAEVIDRPQVLVIDDEPRVGRAVARLLKRDWRVEVAGSGADAIRRFEAGERYAAVVCDLMMADIGGMELHAWVTEHAPELEPRLVFLTGGACTPEAARFLAAPGRRWLEKPADPRTLRDAVAELAKEVA